MKKLLPWIFGGILIVAVIVTVIVMNPASSNTVSHQVNNYQQIHKLNIDVQSDVVVKSGSKFKVESNLPTAKENKIKLDDDEIRITEKAQHHFMGFHLPNFVLNIAGFFHPQKNVTIVTLPKDIQLTDVVINSDSGDVKLSDTSLAALKIDANSGDVNLANVNVKHNAVIGTDSGDSILKNIVVANISVDSDSGDVDADNLKAQRINLNSDSGDVNIKNQSDTTYAKAVIDSASGDINLKNTVVNDSEVTADSGDVNLSNSKLIDKK